MTFDADLLREQRDDEHAAHEHAFQKADRLAEKGGGWEEYDRRLARVSREADLLQAEIEAALRRAA